MRIAAYLRVSTAKQADDGVSIGMQKQIIINHCVRTELVEDESEITWYVDDGWSAKSLERPAMRSLIDDIKLQCVKILIAYDMSRISRDMTDMMLLLRMFEKYHVVLKCIYDNPTFETASEKFLTTIKMATNQYERERISERTRDALISIAESGRYPYGGMIHYGYTRDSNKQMVINPEEALVVEEIFRMASEGYRMKEVIAVANLMQDKTVFSARRIKRILENRKYTGLVNVYGKEYEGLIPAIVTQEVQKKAVDNLVSHAPKSPEYLYSMLLECQSCGKILKCHSGYGKMKKLYFYYICPECQKRISQIDIDREMNHISLSVMDRNYAQHRDDLRRIAFNLNARIYSLRRHYLEGGLDDKSFSSMMMILEEELEDVQDRQQVTQLEENQTFGDLTTPAQKKLFIEKNIERIVIDLDKKKICKIRYKK